MTSTLKVDTIAHSGGTSAMTINSSGDTTHTGKVLKAGNPCFRMSGVAGYGGGAGSDGAAIRRLSGYTITINNNGTVEGETTATGVS